MTSVIFSSARTPAGAADEPSGRPERGGSQDAFASLLAEMDVRTAPQDTPPMGRASGEGAAALPQGLTGRRAPAVPMSPMGQAAMPAETAPLPRALPAVAPETPAADGELAALLARPVLDDGDMASRPPASGTVRPAPDGDVPAMALTRREGAAVLPDARTPAALPANARPLATTPTFNPAPTSNPAPPPSAQVAALVSPPSAQVATPVSLPSAQASTLAPPQSAPVSTLSPLLDAPASLSLAEDEVPLRGLAPQPHETASPPAAPEAEMALSPTICVLSAAMIGALGPVAAPGLEEATSSPSPLPLATAATRGETAPEEAPLAGAKVVLCETHFAPVTPRDLRPRAAMLPTEQPALRGPAPAAGRAPSPSDEAAVPAPAIAVEADMPPIAPRPPLAVPVRLGASEKVAAVELPTRESRAEAAPPSRQTAGAERMDAVRGEREAPAVATGGTAPAVTLSTVPPLPGAAPSPAAVQLGAAIAEAVRADVPATFLAGETMPARGPVRILEIQLNPLELGLVTVRLRTGRNGLEIHVHAARAETARLLEQDRSSLLATLVEADAGPLDLTISQTGMPAPLTGDDAFAPTERDRSGGDEPRDGQPGDSDSRRKRQQNGQAPFRAADSGAAD
ncbi:flagellar hook-length control protein FliK [Ancylobacter rudongensis]|uniref:Hook-length control protein FliK n=1 Tax=Ancylobacter rudongensis TaxID=177413 RepID=A0A1G4UM31_9HYPH|nr:flagellar hook-length control protein FliK [Ancylobacter rudongensis]SCW94706.1 hook-length control protein FliK [Ancylobacter rudongensis]